MQPPTPSLLVLRSDDIEASAAFYRLLGMSFNKHAHGNGPEHYASETNGFVFEIYPASEKFPASSSTRLGFTVCSVDQSVMDIESANHQVLSGPQDSPWGRRAVIVDPDSHRVELTEKPTSN